ncbi:MAG TPA: right-handed parallel beta-helix repeat-containing protein [Blastocatellia bacterium]|nr:right-handed parallel beta-helix repeat-containing protein [Blastocatellia bacterium]
MSIRKNLPLSFACFSTLVLLICVEFNATNCLATTYTVDPGAPATPSSFQSLSALLSALTLHGGDVVKLKSGVVYRDRIRFGARHSGAPGLPVIIESDGPNRAVWDGSTTNVDQYGYLWTFAEDSHDIEVRRIEVRNVQPGPDRNNRGIYIRGANITARECYVHHNPNGFFSTTPAANTVIESCEVAFNGYGDGRTHNFYMASVGMHVRYNYIHDATGGINYKDRSTPDAQGVAVEFSYNWVENAPGAYELDFSRTGDANGGVQDAYLVGNVIIKSATAANHAIIVFGNDGRRGRLWMNNNTIIAGNDAAGLLNLAADATAGLSNNIYYGSTRLFASSAGTAVSGASNWLMTGTSAPGLSGSLYGDDPGFVDRAGKNYHLQPNSVAVGAGSPAGSALLVPVREYAGQASSIPRTDGGRTLGAFSQTAVAPPSPTPVKPVTPPSPLPIRRTGPRRVLVIRK